MNVRAGVVAIAALAVCPIAAAQAPQPNVSLGAVLDAANAYVAGYRAKLQYVIADELYEQRTFNAAGVQTARRVLRSDFFQALTPKTSDWLSVRDVIEVDGVSVPNRQDLRTLLAAGTVARVGRALADRNARYNIGQITRNFNEPMLGLAYLTASHRPEVRFRRARVDTTPEGPLVVVTFTERDRTTIVRSAAGRPLPASGEALIEAATGRVRRTLLRFKIDYVVAEITSTFDRDPKLDLWLPTSMAEFYDIQDRRLRGSIRGDATYTNYRRFDATVIIR